MWLTFFRVVEASFKAYSSLLILQAVFLENENYAFLSTVSLWCFFRESIYFPSSLEYRAELGKHSIASLPFKEVLVNLLHSKFEIQVYE